MAEKKKSIKLYLLAFTLSVVFFALGCTVRYTLMTDQFKINELSAMICFMPLCYFVYTVAMFYWKTMFYGTVMLAHYIGFWQYLKSRKKMYLIVSCIANFILGYFWVYYFVGLMGI